MKKIIYSKESELLRNWLKEKRLDVGLSIRGVADKLDIHHSILGKIETGERQVGAIELIKFCEVLNADINEIIDKLNIT